MRLSAHGLGTVSEQTGLHGGPRRSNMGGMCPEAEIRVIRGLRTSF